MEICVIISYSAKGIVNEGKNYINLDYKYIKQLEAHKKAFKETTGNDADAYIYHIAV